MSRALLVIAVGGSVACGGVQEKSDDSPVVETIEPSSGPQAGGTEVTLSGRGLDFGEEATPTRVVIGTAVVEATIVDDNTVTFVTPPGPEGDAQVFLFHGGGAVPVPDVFTYATLPTIRDIEPAIASTGGTITIRGSGFAGSVSVDLGAAPLENIDVLSDTVLTGTVPTAADAPFAPVDVAITTANGSVSRTEAFQYTGQGLLGIRGVRSSNNLRDERNRGAWYYVDPNTAEAHFIVTSAIPVSKATVAANGDVLGVTDRSEPRVIGAVALDDFSVPNPTTLSAGTRAVDVVVDGNQYFEYEDSTILRRFDLTTGVLLANVTLTVGLTRPACFFRNNATTLFAIGQLDGALNTVNKANGTVTAGATLNGPALPCHSATRIGSEIFVIGWDRINRESTLFRLNAATAQLTEVGLITENGEPVAIRSVVPTPPSF